MDMAVAPPERRECVPTSSGANLSIVEITRWFSALRTEIMYEALVESIPWLAAG